MQDVGKGIVELIEQHSITKLIMGAAANTHYSEYEPRTHLLFHMKNTFLF